MATRTHLRSRVFAITAVYAAMLLLIAFVLTSEGRESARTARRLVKVDVDAVRQLNSIAGNQTLFQHQWEATPPDDSVAIAALVPRYRSVVQVVDDPSSPVVPDLLPKIQKYQERESAAAAAWPGLDDAGRAQLTGNLGQLSREITQLARDESAARNEEIKLELPRLEDRATNLIWIAVAIAWIIAIISFAIARLTLAKVVRPLEELSKAAEQIAAGDLSARAPVAGDREIAQLGLAFNHMADALARSHGELRERARTDELTTLPNFRAFRELLDGEFERAGRYGHHFAILILDLDHFKKYNDRYGHLAGNEALQSVSVAMRSCVRTVDFAARYGGEEFAVVLPEIDIEGLTVIAERMRVSVQDLPPLDGRDRITVSIGGAIFPADGLKAEELFAAADRRLYEAKGKGRNCCVLPRAAAATKASRLRA